MTTGEIINGQGSHKRTLYGWMDDQEGYLQIEFGNVMDSLYRTGLQDGNEVDE